METKSMTNRKTKSRTLSDIIREDLPKVGDVYACSERSSYGSGIWTAGEEYTITTNDQGDLGLTNDRGVFNKSSESRFVFVARPVQASTACQIFDNQTVAIGDEFLCVEAYDTSVVYTKGKTYTVSIDNGGVLGFITDQGDVRRGDISKFERLPTISSTPVPLTIGALNLSSRDIGASFTCVKAMLGTTHFTEGRSYTVTRLSSDSFGLMSDKASGQAGSVSKFVRTPYLPVLGSKSDTPTTASQASSSNPKDAIGLTKPSIHCVPPVSIYTQAAAMTDGVSKYGLMNWRENDVLASVYYNAAQRHLMSWFEGEQVASDSGVHHLGHALACLGIILDAEHGGNLIDDRPIAGSLPKFLKDSTHSASK